MAKVEFEIEDGFTVLSGVAVVQAVNEEGYLFIFNLEIGSPKPVEQIGLLTTALDQMRYTFVDKIAEPETIFGDGEDREED